jgi:hypothetical protein
VYLDGGATLDLAGGVIEDCWSRVGYGGGVYVDKNASVLVSGPSAVIGNTSGSKHVSDNVCFNSNASCTNKFVITNTSPVSDKAIGVRYYTSLKGNVAGFVFAEAEDALAASQTVSAFFSDASADLVAVVTNSTGIAWADKAAAPAGPVPVDPSDPGAMALAVAKVDYPDSSEKYWFTVKDAFASLEGESGSATVTLLSDSWFYWNIAVPRDIALTLLSTNAPACSLTRLDDVSIDVGEGSSLSVSNLVFRDSALAEANSPMFSVAGGTLEFLDGAAVVDVKAYGRFGAAVTVMNGTASSGTFLMRDGALIANCSNFYEYPFDGTAYAGGLLVGGRSVDGTAPAATAWLAGGAITNCMAYRSGGVYVGNGGAIYVSGDVKVVDNFSSTNGVAALPANLTVAASASLVLEDVLTGEVGVHRDIAADMVVFGGIGESFSGSDADRVASAMNFTSDDGWGYGVTVGTNGSAVATHLAWSDGLATDGTYVAKDGTLYSLVSDSDVKFPVDPPTAVSGLVYNGKEQVGAVALRGYDLAGTLSATDAGTYTNTATLWPGYVWSDDTYEVKTQVWEIAKASYDMSGVTFEDKTFIYDGAPKSLEISGELPGGVTVKYSANKWTMPAEYVVTASFTGDANNYEPIDDMTAKLRIVRAVALPTARTDLVYDAAAQTGVAAGDGYSLSGEVTGTDAGTNYTAIASLDDLTVWPDGTTNDLEIVWSIGPAPLAVAASDAWKYVGDDDPLAFAYTVDGLQGTDVAADVLVGALARVNAGTEEGERVGAYAITKGDLAVADGVSNYFIESFRLGTFRIRAVPTSVLPDLPPGATPADVAQALAEAGLTDGDVAAGIGAAADPVAAYDSFKEWAGAVTGGEEAVAASDKAWVSYEFGVTELFENVPAVTFTSMAIENPATASMNVKIVVKDGEADKVVDPASVAKLFEVSANLVTWTDDVTATPNPDGSYTIQPNDPSLAAAFIRLKY